MYEDVFLSVDWDRVNQFQFINDFMIRQGCVVIFVWGMVGEQWWQGRLICGLVVKGIDIMVYQWFFRVCCILINYLKGGI